METGNRVASRSPLPWGVASAKVALVAVCVQCRSEIEAGASYCPHCGAAQPGMPPVAAARKRPSKSRLDEGTELDLGWGKVVVGDTIGEGGMGIVYRSWLYYNPEGEHAGTPPHPVALKVLHPALRGRERPRQLFLGEAMALERLNHPNIVRFFALSNSPEYLAIVIELVDGQALNEIITRKVLAAKPGGLPALPFARAWHYFSQLLGALASIHALAIIHRDVKPANVLVRRDGFVKLTDFGIARVPADTARNTGGMAPGTGAYMAPEQVVAGDLDARTDLYSAAIVLYEMLTGITPFDRPDRNEIMVRTAQVEETPAPITQHVPQAPKVLDMLMARALAKDKMHRFPSAIEMGEAFREALGLPDSSGWEAQQAFAENARAISQAMPAVPSVTTPSPGEPTPSPPAGPPIPIAPISSVAIGSAPRPATPAELAATLPRDGTEEGSPAPQVEDRPSQTQPDGTPDPAGSPEAAPQAPVEANPGAGEKHGTQLLGPVADRLRTAMMQAYQEPD